MTFWAYMLHCHAGRLYVGHTDSLERRIANIPGFTRDYLAVRLVWSEEFPSRIEALETNGALRAGSVRKNWH